MAGLRLVIVCTAALAAFFVTTITARSAHAEPTVGVLQLDVRGDAATKVAEALRASTERTLADAGWAAKFLVDDRAVKDCPLDNRCLPALAKTHKLGRFLRIRVQTSGGRFMSVSFGLALLRADSSSSASEDGNCVNCNVKQTVAAVRKSLIALLSKDTPGERKPVPPAKPSAATTSRYGALKWITLSAGVALAAGGATLLAFDGHTRGCQPSGCREVYESTNYGIGLLGAGAVLTAASIYMFVTDKQTSERVLAVVPSRGGAAALVHWTF